MDAEGRIAAALTALADGTCVVVVEDAEGSAGAAALVVAAAGLQPARLAFVVRESSGIVCAVMPAERLDRSTLERVPGIGRSLAGTIGEYAKTGQWAPGARPGERPA